MLHRVIETLKETKIGASEKRVQNRFFVKLILAATVSIGLTSVTTKPAYSKRGSWEQLSGAATDIGVGANGAVFTIGTNKSDGGYGIWKWTGNQWQALPGGGVRIAVDPNGTPWVVDDRGTIFRWRGGKWAKLPGAAKDIGIGANGSVFTIGTNKSDGGYGIWKWTGNQWQALPGGGVRIAVDPRGTPWVVDDRGTIFRWRGGKWAKLPGAAKDIGIGANGSVFVVGTERSDGGFGIFKWKRGGWKQIPGGAVNISVGPSGTPWVTDSSNNIFRKGDDRESKGDDRESVIDVIESFLPPSVQDQIKSVLPPSVQAQGEYSGLTCQTLWHERNAILARKGYCFKTPRAQAVFGKACFAPFGKLSKAEAEEAKLISRLEALKHCPKH